MQTASVVINQMFVTADRNDFKQKCNEKSYDHRMDMDR